MNKQAKSLKPKGESFMPFAFSFMQKRGFEITNNNFSFARTFFNL